MRNRLALLVAALIVLNAAAGCCCPLVCKPIGDLIGIDAAPVASVHPADEVLPTSAATSSMPARY